MKIIQTSREEISPISSLSKNPIVEGTVGTIEYVHRDAKSRQWSTASTHYEYLAYGSGSQISIVSQSIADSGTANEWQPVDNALDISEWPTIRRNSGVNSFVSAQISNGISTTEKTIFDFKTKNGSYSPSAPHAAVAGSVLDITSNIVSNLADAMTSNLMWDGDSNRAQTTVIPHQYLTGHVWKGGTWGTPGIIGGLGSGKRFMAITKRHVQACGHYGYAVGEILKFKDINNNIIDRTVIQVMNFYEVNFMDMSIYLLNEDLPESITVLPVMGAWGKGIFDETTEQFIFCPQHAGIILYNNDGHLRPCIVALEYDLPFSNTQWIYQGLSIKLSEIQSAIGDGLNTIKSFPSKVVGDKFYHNVRPGDSGSPYLVPCAGGWCYASHLSSQQHPTPDLFNRMIAFIDARAVASGVLNSPTNYTVTVAQPPTA